MPPETPCLTARVFQTADFTTFVKGDTEDGDGFQKVKVAIEKDGRYEESLVLKPKDVTNDKEYVSGRSLICSCFGGRWLSVTLRTKKDETQTWREAVGPPSGMANHATEYEDPPPSFDSPTPDYAFPIPLLCDALFHRIARSGSLSGAILITGGTGSGKTKVACGILYRYLQFLHGDPGDRGRPHLVTIEKPIEKRLASDPLKAQGWGIDYTPRLIGTDVKDLRQGLEDALRQTPAAVYLGELRRDAELQDLLWFAGTGHLVIATAHAGSLVESMDKLLRQGKADTAARRQQTGQVLSAVIQLRPGLIPKPQGGPTTVTLPAVWTQTPAGLNALVADGLASLLPNNPADGRECNTLGRFFFATELLKRHQVGASKRPAASQNDSRHLSDELQKAIRHLALRWDLEGM
jgi:Tfp pilus assembly pilus retraction ATPase PilT